MTTLLRLTGLVGLILFGILFWLTFGVPEKVEQSAKGFVKSQIETEIRQQYADTLQSPLATKAMNIAAKLGYQEDGLIADLEQHLPEKIASAIASMCGYDCEKRKAVAAVITSGYIDKIKSLKLAQSTLGDIVKGKYIEIVGNLKTDLRIFLGTNSVLFLLLLTLSRMKSDAIRLLSLPAVLLFISTVISSCIYLFGQDWFYTIIYNDYMGYGYIAYVAVIFGLFADIIFNRGVITSTIVNAILALIGGILSLIPC